MTLRRTRRAQKVCLKWKEVLLLLYYIIPFYQRIPRIIFKICFSRSCSPSQATKHIFWKFFSPAGTFWLPKTIRQVLAYITEFAGVISGGCATLCANNSTDPFVLELSSLVESHTPSIAFGSAVLILSSSGPFLFEYSNLLWI